MINFAEWREYALYTIALPETGRKYNSVQLGTRRGVGIVQWSYGRSWDLLNLYATDYPDEAEEHLGSLWNEVKKGSTRWSDRIFTDGEANLLISDTLKQPNMIKTQNKLWNRDLDKDYIPLLEKLNIDDTKGSIFALSLYHHRPVSFYEVAQGVGNGSVSDWYNGAINNGFFGGYKTRQKQILNCLTSWNGKSAPPNNWANVDGKPVNGGNVDWNGGNPKVDVDDNNIREPSSADDMPNTSTGTSKVSFGIGKIERIGRDMFRQHFTIGGRDTVGLFYRESPTLWTCTNSDEILAEVQQVKEDTGQKDIDEEVDEDIIEPGGGTAPTKAQKAIDFVKSKKGQLTYSQNASQRTNVDGGYADCSGLVYWAYRKAGVKNIGTTTYTQFYNGKLIATIHNDSEYKNLYLDKGLCQAGDIIIFAHGTTSGSTYHVEMIDSDGTIWGINSPAQKGPTQKNTPSQAGGNFSVAFIRRLVTTKTVDKNKSVFLTAGHGGSDPGKVANGYNESEINLWQEIACGNYLRDKGYSVKYSRTDDSDDPVEEEVEECNKSGCKVSVSCHNNAGGGIGFECYYNTSKPQAKRLAELIIGEMKAIGAPMHNDPLKSGDHLMYCNSTNIPVVLCEGGFVDSSDIKRITPKSNSKKIGEAYAKAIIKWFN